MARGASSRAADAVALRVYVRLAVTDCRDGDPSPLPTNWARRAGQDAPELLPDYDEVSVSPMLKLPKGTRNGFEVVLHKGTQVIAVHHHSGLKRISILAHQLGDCAFELKIASFSRALGIIHDLNIRVHLCLLQELALFVL